MKAISSILLFAFILSVWARTAEEWKSRAIYQILTDRFGRTDNENLACSNLWDYCGGTFKGIEKNLDYIQGMGINAIWISPVWKNAPEGYHGYWVTNFYEINENFGTKQDFIDLINACHERDIWVMVDVVPNHVAPVTDNVTDPTGDEDFSGIYPFNDRSHYHIPILRCKDVFENDPTNTTALEYCWLWRLPDLNHENEDVTRMLLDWIKDFIQTYHVDGLRLDALRHVPNWFWHEFSKAAGVYTIGESFHSEISVCAEYQGAIDSLLNFPLQDRLERIFQKGESMNLLTKYYEEAVTGWPDFSVLGNFVTNHDIPRFLYNNSDIAGFKAVYAFVLSVVGIPSVFYGDEQFFDGGIDPDNRASLWGKMNTESEMYQYLKTIITFRQKSEFYKHEQIERLADEMFYAFSRGDYFFAFTNSADEQVRMIRNHPYPDNTRLCNAFNEKDCVTVVNGEFEVRIMNKEPKILSPHQVPDQAEGIAQSIWKGIKNFWNVGVKGGFSNSDSSFKG